MKYWAYVNNEILGPYEKEKLLELPSFSPSLLVCPQTPVGEKTEDWKEASSYPELSALIGGAGLSAGKPAAAEPLPQAQPQTLSAPEPAAQPAPAASAGFKPLTASSIDPVPPSHNAVPGIEIPVNRLGKAGGLPAAEPAAAAPAPAASASPFDPISLSTIQRRSDTIGAEAPVAGDMLAKEPPKAFPDMQPAAAAPAAEPAPAPSFAPSAELPPQASPAPAPAPAPAAAPQMGAPEIETFSRPAASYAAPAIDKGIVDGISQRLESLSKAAATRQDLAAATDPLRVKLDQLSESLSAFRNSQFQREVMDKLSYLENAVGDLKSELKALKAAGPAATALAPATISGRSSELKIERNSETVFGAQAPRAEKPKVEAPKPAAKETVIVDQGSKSSKVGPLIKKLVKAVVTIVLLVAVLLGAVIGLKMFGIFDATGFIPFQLPFVSQPKPEAPAETQPAEAQPAAQPAGQAQGQAQPAAQPAAQPQAAQPAAPKEPELAPEVTYFTRTYKAAEGGPTLENKIAEHAARNGGDFDKASWNVAKLSEGMFEISATMPGKGGSMAYTFVVNYDKKTVLPGDDNAKAAFASLAPAKAGRGKKVRGAAKAPAQPAAAKPAPAKKAAAKKAAAEDEYEYVYEDEDAAGQ